MSDAESKIEEWKMVRSTIVEFDNILLQLRTVDVTASIVMLGAGFEYSRWLLVLVSLLNFVFWLLEWHYHLYLNSLADHAISLESEIGFNLTHILKSTRDSYKNKSNIKKIRGYLVSNGYHFVYLIFIIVGLYLFFFISKSDPFLVANHLNNTTNT
ncbi:MAG: hypothetical protein WBL02_10140 [Methanomethylovorans sp.]|uniref:hypothetical protein n=1 Tax=Methanomethylovorans sp. TaxID=2758717 RepID=UPI003C790B3E